MTTKEQEAAVRELCEIAIHDQRDCKCGAAPEAILAVMDLRGLRSSLSGETWEAVNKEDVIDALHRALKGEE